MQLGGTRRRRLTTIPSYAYAQPKLSWRNPAYIGTDRHRGRAELRRALTSTSSALSWSAGRRHQQPHDPGSARRSTASSDPGSTVQIIAAVALVTAPSPPRCGPATAAPYPPTPSRHHHRLVRRQYADPANSRPRRTLHPAAAPPPAHRRRRRSYVGGGGSAGMTTSACQTPGTQLQRRSTPVWRPSARTHPRGRRGGWHLTAAGSNGTDCRDLQC